MRHGITKAMAWSLASFAVLGCKTEAPTASDAFALERFANSEWSAPTNLGDSINSEATDQNATLSKDGLTLYFSSARMGDGAQGTLDIWVSRRGTTADPWGTPLNLGLVINTSAAELAPNLSIDGHLLFFTSNRLGSTPVAPGSDVLSVDIYMSRRTNTDDDFDWGDPVKLGPEVNTANADQAPMYLQNAEDGFANLYFNRGILATGQGDIYYAAITRDGESLGPAVRVDELNVAGASEAAASIRHDGREIFFWSNREGTQDLWTSTRQSVHHPWSAPTKLDAPLSTASNDLTPNLSFDGRTLIFASNRSPSFGGNDLWISTRTRSGE